MLALLSSVFNFLTFSNFPFVFLYSGRYSQLISFSCEILGAFFFFKELFLVFWLLYSNRKSSLITEETVVFLSFLLLFPLSVVLYIPLFFVCLPSSRPDSNVSSSLILFPYLSWGTKQLTRTSVQWQGCKWGRFTVTVSWRPPKSVTASPSPSSLGDFTIYLYLFHLIVYHPCYSLSRYLLGTDFVLDPGDQSVYDESALQT